MEQTVRQAQTKPASAAAVPFIAADVGGTHARVGLVCADADGAPPAVLAYRRYDCAQWPSLAAILGDFRAKDVRLPVTDCALACAGYAVGDEIVNENLPWPVSVRELRQALALDDIAVVNDFAALAYAMRNVDADAGFPLNDAARPDKPGPLLVVGPGTGLGSALLIPQPPRPIVLATEAGQSALAPRTAIERAILGVLARNDAHVSTESVLSGPGLLTLYRALCTLGDTEPTLTEPDEVSAAALDGSDAVARQALEVFCALLGSFVGDLVLLYGAAGGVYLAGGILPQVREFLVHSNFVERFVDKRSMRAFLERVPVRLIEHGKLGVIGAAGWYLDHRQERRGHACRSAT